MSFLLVVLNAGALCVARTDVCAPAGSTMAGTIGPQGGQVTITPAAPMSALGAVFKTGAPLLVSVLPWGSSDGAAGAVVHVAGELAKESMISGARVAGAVTIGQIQGRPGAPQLVTATDFKSGKLSVFAAGTVDVVPGMRIQGNAEIGGGRVEINSTLPMHAHDLDFAAGTLRIEQRASGPTFTGKLARAQELGGVLVEGFVSATIEPGRVRFTMATLARTTALSLLGLPTGDAPAGTTVSADLASTRLVGPGPVRVCGIPVLPVTTFGQPVVTLTNEQGGVALYGALAGPDVDVGGGLHLTGGISVHLETATCKRRSIEGTLARDSAQDGLLFAKKAVFAIGELGKDRVVRGTLAQTAVVDSLTLTGAAMISVTLAGDVHLLEGTLADPAPFEQWQLPARSHVQRSGVDAWSFEVPAGTSARATADHRGERVDHVSQANSDGISTAFQLTRPHQPKGTKLALRRIGIDHQTACVLGDVATVQRFGVFVIPAGGNVMVCRGTIVAAEGTYAVPSLQVGSWFATKAIADVAGSQPPSELAPSPATSPASASGTLAGYWLQINSLCQGRSGIPLPPPPQRWIWVDLKGQATRNADQLVLAKNAAKAGTACPVTPCCPP